MSSFLVADYMDWFACRPIEPSATIAFTVIYLLVYFFTWNYFAAFAKQNGKAEALI